MSGKFLRRYLNQAPYSLISGNPIFPDELIEQGRLLPVEMLEALCDEDYYVRFVERALSQT